MLLARPGALALVALGVARACDCPWQFDGECDVGNGCDCDPFDCSECGRLVTCEACASRGDCVYCAAESLCAPADDVPTPAFLAGHGKVSTCAADDFVATCGGGAAASPDPYYGAAAWYLDLMNVEAAWASGVTGAGVRIRVNDDGVDASHPDLSRVASDKFKSKDKTARRSRRDFDFGFDFDFDFEDAAACPFSSEEVCGACDGDDWASGSLSDACEDAVVGWCTSDLDFDTDPEACLDFDEYFVTCGHGQLSRSEAAAFRRGVTEGRGGKGTVYASGDDVNFEGELQSRYTMSIAAVGRDGLHASYSSVGAPVFAAAPGGDGDHVHNIFTALPRGGPPTTAAAPAWASYAAPLVAGVVALVLEANLTSAGATYQYGFGVVDAGAAVAAARTWATYGPEKVLASKTYANRALPDFGGAGETWVASTEATGFAGHGDFVVEHVAVLLTVAHERRGDVRVILERGAVWKSTTAPAPARPLRLLDLFVYGHTVEPESDGAVLASDGAAPRAATAGAAVAAAAALLLFGAL
ncbi:serine-type endopeptidase [Aureococcus anophagefferens]|nr:serine-type endopeptidase [Aureococcus anophagefferens]